MIINHAWMCMCPLGSSPWKWWRVPKHCRPVCVRKIDLRASGRYPSPLSNSIVCQKYLFGPRGQSNGWMALVKHHLVRWVQLPLSLFSRYLARLATVFGILTHLMSPSLKSSLSYKSRTEAKKNWLVQPAELTTKTWTLIRKHGKQVGFHPRPRTGCQISHMTGVLSGDRGEPFSVHIFPAILDSPPPHGHFCSVRKMRVTRHSNLLVF